MASQFYEKSVLPSIGTCVILWCFCGVTSNFRTDFRLPKWTRQMSDDNLTDVPEYVIQFQEKYLYPTKKLLRNMLSEPRQIEKSRRFQKTQRKLPESTEFFCNTRGTRSPTRPTNVHELRPGDIDVVGAIGDSLTVATGSFSYTVPQLVIEHRGVSFTGGGQGTWKEFLTIPNIIKEFNPKLIGYAYSDSTSEERFSQFNVAEVGALSKDMPYMAKELVKRIRNDKRVNVNEDWKLISILVSPNTYCQELCYNDYTTYPEKHREEITKTLLYIKENLPRTFINLVISPNLEMISNFTKMPPICLIMRTIFCPCLFGTQHRHRFQDYLHIMNKFKEVEWEIMENEAMKDKDDFTVVLQPFSDNLTFPINPYNGGTDLSYLGSDCFHLSQKGYARLANALWNNMFEPVGRKTINWSKELDRFICPTDEFPYIRTWKNSQPT